MSDALAYEGGFRFVQLPEKLATDRRLKPRDREVWVVLAQLAWYGCRDFPSHGTTASVLGLKSSDPVERSVGRLVAAGWIKKKVRPGLTNVYVICPSPRSAKQLPTIPEAFLHAGHNIYALNKPTRTTRFSAGTTTRFFAGHSPFKEGFEEVRAPHENRAAHKEDQGMRESEAEANLPDPDEGVPRPTKVRRRTRDASTRRASDPAPTEDNRVSRGDQATTSKDLAWHFRRTAEARWTFAQMGPAPFNMEKLGGGIAQWKREGHSAAVIRTMIEIFCTDPVPKTSGSGIELWRGFLADRQRLFNQAHRIEESKQPAAARYAAPPVA